MRLASVANALEYAILGYKEDAQFMVLHRSNGLPAQDTAHYRQLASIEPMTNAEGELAPTLALLPYDEDSALLAEAHLAGAPGSRPVYQFLLLPYALLSEPSMGLTAILDASPLKGDGDAIEEGATWNLSADTEEAPTRAGQLALALGDVLKADFESAMTLLGAMLHERRLLIRNFPRDYALRLDLISSLRALMPHAVGATLTFSTSSLESSQNTPHLIFADDVESVSQWTFDWEKRQVLSGVSDHPYLDLLRTSWQGDISDFAAAIDKLDQLAEPDWQSDPGESLARVARRHMLNAHVMADGEVATDPMIAALTGLAPPAGELRSRYVTKLLENALHNRDVLAGKQVAEELERDQGLEAKLSGAFDEMLEEQPDTVYVFIRNRLHHLGVDEKWIPRLQIAARDSLEVAIEDGDVPTLISWLELIAHEPLSYQLQDILRDGVMAALERARENGELGIHLILIAVRRLPELVDRLYEDEDLVGALPEKLSAALRETAADTLEPLIDESAEYFLLALFHGFETSDDQFVTAVSVAYLWSLFESEVKVNLPIIYRPAAVIRALASRNSYQLTEDALDALLKHIVSGDDRELLVDTARHLAERDQLFPRLNTLLESDELSVERVLSTLNAISHIDNVSARDVVDAYFQLLDFYEWEPATQPMMEALARLMAKSHSLQLSYRHLWKHFENCNILQIESATRASIVQLLQQLSNEVDQSQVVESVARICRQGGWSKTLLATLNAWWRDYTHGLSLAQLQKLERELEGQRQLEAQKQILKTVLAMRRWMHNRDATAFAAAVNSAFSIMEHLTEAFDVGQLTEIDPLTLRRELDRFGAELSADERHILASNLRNLAHLVTSMAERRSKPSLIRSDDSIERQLSRGEATPHGSIDMMKWIAGYLDGAHQGSGE